MCFSFLSRNQLLRWSIFALVIFPVSVLASVQEETSKGDAAFKLGKMKDADGKQVARPYNVISGKPGFDNIPQEMRNDVSGKGYPMPDGTYKVHSFDEHGPLSGALRGLGDWSAYVGSGDGNMGERSGMMIHSDIDPYGTLGCIGVNLGGEPGTKAEKTFLKSWNKANPETISVDFGAPTGSTANGSRSETSDNSIAKMSSNQSGSKVSPPSTPNGGGGKLAMVGNGGSGGSIDLSVSGGSGSYSYLWSNGTTTQDLTSLSAGTYSVTVTDNICGNTETTSVTITEPAALNVAVSSVGSSTVCSGSTVSLSMSTYASPANTYQWSDANGAISGATSSTYSATASGTYSLTVTTPAGCSATSSGFVVTIISLSAPSGLSTSNIELNKATMNWSAVTNAHHYDIRMRAQGSSSWTVAINNIIGTSQLKSNLTSSTTYEWEIRSACSSDSSSVSAWSSTQTFTTLTPCTAPLNPVTTGIGLTAATLGWDAVSGAWGYRVRYKLQSQPWSAWVYDTVTTNTYSLTGLSNSTAYHWQVSTMCAASGVNN